MRLGRAPLLAGIVAIVGLAGTLAAAAPSAAAPNPASVVLTASAAPALPAGAVRLGALAPQTSLRIDVTLNVRDQTALTALLNGLADKKSPYYRHFLHGGQFGAMFGPTLAQVAEVADWLRARGLTPGQVDSDRLSIPVTATAAAIEQAFGVSLLQYRLPGGRVAFANSAAPRVPATVAPVVQGIIGLDDLGLSQGMAMISPGPKTVARTAAPAGPAVPGKAAAGPKACTAASDQALATNAYTPAQFASHYGMTTLYDAGDLGQGVHVAIAELDPDLASDISTYETCYGITTPVNYFTVDPGLGTGAGAGEAALDIETIAGLAPGATLDVYQAPDTIETNLYDIMTSVVGKDTDQVLNISYGLCELEVSNSLYKAYENIMAAAYLKAITVLAAAGDYGSTGCYPYAFKKSLSVEVPASVDYVNGVGGTTMSSAGWASKEVVWNTSKAAIAGLRGAGGGGVSIKECMPAYMLYHEKGSSPVPGVISSLSKKTASCKSSADPKGYLREVPDLSAAADPTHGYVFYYDGSWDWYIGGTSAATALTSAEAALIDASPLCGPDGWNTGPAGFLPVGLYQRVAIDQAYIYYESYNTQAPFVLYDIRNGNNDYTPSGYTGGLYPSKKGGFDMASGLGVPLLASPEDDIAPLAGEIASEMCLAYAPASAGNISTRFVFPDYARAGSTVTVTVHGTGYLPVAGTDWAEVTVKVGPNYEEPSAYDATCSNRTTCQVVLFGLPAGTYGIQIYPASLNACTGCKALVQFQSAGTPHVSALSPAKGKRGTKVTITGKYFLGVTAVHFGGTTLTSFKVVSSTKIVVTAPSGSGKEKVTVTAVGGTSNGFTFTYT